MSLLVVFAMTALLGCAGGPTSVNKPLRIDASSDASVERSMAAMMASLKYDEQIQLAMAILQLNMAGVSSARQLIGNPDLQHPSAAKVKDRIAGKTADEIIALAKRTATTKIVISGQEPGLPADATRALRKGPPVPSIASSRWRVSDNTNGHTSVSVFEFRPDGTAIDEAHADQAAGKSTWEQSSDEVRVLLNDKYAFLVGRIVDGKTMSGTGGNKMGSAWTWSAERL
ncbi:MAG: DUF6694 family lipoprotein [Caldimonas sp.]